MQVVILAGGLGTRLSEETEKIPKPMVTIGDIPILLHIMGYYASFGHKNFLIALGYKGYVIKDYFSNFRSHNSNLKIDLNSGAISFFDEALSDWNVTLVETGLETMTGGRLLKLQPHLEDEFMLTYGDGLSDIDLDVIENQFKKSKRIGLVSAVRPPARFGSLQIEENFVTKFSEKVPQDSGWINGGYFCFRKEICSYISDFSTTLEGSPMEKLVEDKQLVAYQHSGFWYGMDTLRDRETLDNLWTLGNPPWRKI